MQKRGDLVSPAKKNLKRLDGLLGRVAEGGGLINVRGACVLCGQERVHSPHRESERREEEEREREKRRRKRETAKEEI